MADGKSMGILPGSTSPSLIMYLTEKTLGPSLEPRPLGRHRVWLVIVLRSASVEIEPLQSESTVL